MLDFFLCGIGKLNFILAKPLFFFLFNSNELLEHSIEWKKRPAGCDVKLLGGKANTDTPGRYATDDEMEIPLRLKNEIKQWKGGLCRGKLKPISTPTNKLALLLDAAGASR